MGVGLLLLIAQPLIAEKSIVADSPVTTDEKAANTQIPVEVVPSSPENKVVKAEHTTNKATSLTPVSKMVISESAKETIEGEPHEADIEMAKKETPSLPAQSEPAEPEFVELLPPEPVNAEPLTPVLFPEDSAMTTPVLIAANEHDEQSNESAIRETLKTIADIESSMIAEKGQVGSVSRSMFTTGIVNREPIDNVSGIAADNGQIYFFTELKNMDGQMIKHRWEYNNEVMAEVEFTVGAPRWRVYSRKNISPEWVGEWTVTVLDNSERVLQTSSFDLTIDEENQPVE